MSKLLELALCSAWAMDPLHIKKMMVVLHRHSSGEKLSEQEIAAVVAARDASQSGKQANDGSTKPYTISASGVATIPVYGVIAKRASAVNSISGPRGASCETIQARFEAALKDSDCREIVLDIDSPGGTVDGVFDLSDLIYNSRGQKRITAFANGQMASAAYAIGSAADRIIVSQDAAVGSIGVYQILQDYSKYLSDMGVKEEMIKAGKYKGLGHPDFPITEETRKVAQEEVDAIYSLFVNAVARNRKMDTAAALKVADGRVHIGKDAVDINLADEVGTLSTLQNAGTKTLYHARSGGRVLQLRRSAVMAKQVEAPDGAEIVGLADITLGDLKKHRPDLIDTIGAEALRGDRERTAGIRAAIAASGLPSSVQGNLALKCQGMTVEAAQKEIARISAIEAALTVAKVQGLDEKSIDCLRADVSDLPHLSAVNLIASTCDKVKGTAKRLVNDQGKTEAGADQPQPEGDEKKALKAAVAEARADYAKIKEGFPDLTEKSFVAQRLDGLKIKASDQEIADLLK